MTKEQEPIVTFEGFVARDMNGEIYVYRNHPVREKSIFGIIDHWRLADDDFVSAFQIDSDFLPYLKWEDEPLKCRIKIEEI